MKKLVEKLKEFFEGFGDCLRTWRRDFHNWFLDTVSTTHTVCVGICIGLLISLKTLVKYLVCTQYVAFEKMGVMNSGC